jgi:hypothetical protein
VARESVPDLSLVAAPVWREAERRAAVIRPLAVLPACPRREAQAMAAVLGPFVLRRGEDCQMKSCVCLER